MIYKATKAAYFNAKDYDQMDLLKMYLNQAISSYKVLLTFLPWKVLINDYSDGWNPYTERKHMRTLEKNQKNDIKEKNKQDPNKSNDKFGNYKIPKNSNGNQRQSWSSSHRQPQASGSSNRANRSQPYQRRTNQREGQVDWKETLNIAQVLMEVKQAMSK